MLKFSISRIFINKDCPLHCKRNILAILVSISFLSFGFYMHTLFYLRVLAVTLFAHLVLFTGARCSSYLLSQLCFLHLVLFMVAHCSSYLLSQFWFLHFLHTLFYLWVLVVVATFTHSFGFYTFCRPGFIYGCSL